MSYPRESELICMADRLGVVTEGEFVMVILALIDLIREAIELALVRIELPLADKGIVVRERDGRSSAQAEAGDSPRAWRWAIGRRICVDGVLRCAASFLVTPT